MAVKQMIVVTTASPSFSSSNEYLPVGWPNTFSQWVNFWGTSELLGLTTPWSVAGTFKNWVITMRAAPPSGKSVTYTLRKNGVDSGLTITIAEPATTGSDLTHTMTISPGDRITIHANVSGTASYTVPLMNYVLEFAGDNAKESGYCTSCTDNFTGVWYTAPNWYCGIGYNAPITGVVRTSSLTAPYTSANCPANMWEVIAVAGAVTRYDILGFSGGALHAPGTGKSMVFNLLKNEIVQDGTGGTVDTTATMADLANTASWTGTLPVVPGDTLRIRMSPVNFISSDAIDFGISWCLTATTDGDFQMGHRHPPAALSGSPVYHFGGTNSTSLQSWSTTESARQAITNPTTFWINSLRAGPAAPDLVTAGAFNNYLLSLRRNLATPTNPLTTYLSSGSYNQPGGPNIWIACNSIAGTVQISSGDTWGLQALTAPATQTLAPQKPCNPQTQVDNGGSGKAGCNSGGVGWVSSYTGPYGAVPAYADPSDGQALTGAREFDVWIELRHTDYPSGTVTTYPKAITELPDPPTYHSGRKAIGLLEVGDIEHGLSNEQGGFVPASCDLKFTDKIDRFWRTLLATQDLEGDELDVFAAPPAARAASSAPHVLGRLTVQREQTMTALETTLTAVDKLFSEFGPFGPNRRFPSHLIGTVFPLAPMPSQQMVLPWLLGEKSDHGAQDPETPGVVVEKGLVPLTLVGEETLTVLGVTGPWDVYLALGHPIYKVIDLYGSNLGLGVSSNTPDRIKIDLNLRAGIDVLVPGYPNWPFGTTYRSYVGTDGKTYWVTVLYAKGPLSEDHKNGVVNMTINAIGVEDVGDGTGLPIIDAHACEQHWLENALINDWTSGVWVTAGTGPKWGDGTPMVRSTSFAAAQAFQVTKVGGRGLTVGWYVDQAAELSEHVAEWNRSTETRLGVNSHGQFRLGWIDDTVDTTTWPRVDHVTEIFGPVHRQTGEERENTVVGVCDWDPDQKRYRAGPFPYSNPAAITQNKNRVRQGDPSGTNDGVLGSKILNVDLHLQNVLQRRLARLKVGATTVQLAGPTGWLDPLYEPGLGLRLNTIEGPGVNGYVDEPMLILRRKYGIRSRLTTLTLLDVGVGGGSLITPAGQRFIATDTIAAPLATDTVGNAPVARL